MPQALRCVRARRPCSPPGDTATCGAYRRLRPRSPKVRPGHPRGSTRDMGLLILILVVLAIDRARHVHRRDAHGASPVHGYDGHMEILIVVLVVLAIIALVLYIAPGASPSVPSERLSPARGHVIYASSVNERQPGLQSAVVRAERLVAGGSAFSARRRPVVLVDGALPPANRSRSPSLRVDGTEQGTSYGCSNRRRTGSHRCVPRRRRGGGSRSADARARRRGGR